MKKLIIILAFFAALNARCSSSFDFIRYYSDTLVSNGKVSLVLNNHTILTWSDSIHVQLYYIDLNKTVYLFKGNFGDYSMLKKTSHDGYDSTTYQLPVNTLIGRARLTITAGAIQPIIFIRSAAPDLKWKYIPLMKGHNGDTIHFKLKYTYKFLVSDTLVVILGGKIQNKIPFSKINYDSTFYFIVNAPIASVQMLSFNLGLGDLGYFTELTPVVVPINPIIPINPINTTSILDYVKLLPNIEIKYYSELGVEINKPHEGLYIWHASNGQSGRVFVSEL